MSFKNFVRGNSVKDNRYKLGFRNYLEDEHDHKYYHMNSLSYYYDKMASMKKIIEQSSKKINEYDNILHQTITENNKIIKELSDLWDEKMLDFPWIEYMTESNERWVI